MHDRTDTLDPVKECYLWKPYSKMTEIEKLETDDDIYIF